MNLSSTIELPLAAQESEPSKYQILRLLGEGGYGQVYEAWDTQLCRRVALKRLKSMADPARADSMLKEARMAASLSHPAFVKVFSLEGDAHAPSIVMELVPGCTLARYMKEQRPSQQAALDLVLQLAEAMQEAHASKLVHGDLKPSNLMREPSGQMRILDFGLARDVDPLATQSALHENTQGTIAYMAPECLLGQDASPRSDLYALGMILYELIVGQRPFGDLRGLALAAAQIQSSSASWPYPPQCDPALARLIRAMTEQDPARRLPSMQAVCAQIRLLQGGGASAVARPAPMARWRRSVLAQRPVLRALIPLGLLSAGLCLWQLTSPRQADSKTVAAYAEAGAMQAGMDALAAPRRVRRLDEAIDQFTRILEHDPLHAGAAAGLSLAYSLRYVGDGHDEAWLQRADASAQQALRQDDQLSLAYVAQAWVRDNQGRREDGLGLVEQALKLDPAGQFALRIKSDLLIHLHRFDDAEQTIRRSALLFPADPWFSDCLGKLRYLQNRYAEAEAAFRQSIRIEPESTFAYGNLSQALLRQGRDAEALQALQQGLRVRPDSRLYGNLGTILFERGDYVAAAQAFEHAVSSSKGNPNLYLNWANLADALRWIPGRSAASREAYRQAALLLGPKMGRAPDDSTLQSRMGLYSAKLGDRAAAARATGQALRLAPSSAQVHFRAAIVYELMGERARALAELASARALGFPANLIDTEPDLLSLRRDLRYHTTNLETSR